MVIKVWVQLLRGGENIGRASQIKLEDDDSNVDDLCDAVKVKFEADLNGISAARLNVSTARESTEYLRPDQELQKLPARTEVDEPLFVHAPALAGGSEQGAAQDPGSSKRSVSRAEVEQIIEQSFQRIVLSRRSDVQDVSSSHSQSHSAYVNIGKKFVDSPPEEFTWQQMLFPISVPEDIEQTANILLHSFQQHVESHSGKLLEKDLQEWCKKSLCSKTTSDAQDGMDWSPRSLLDTSSGKQRSSDRNKPDLTMTNDRGLTPYGTIAFIELKSYEENLEPSNTGQVMYAVQEALKRCKLRSHMFAFLTNFKTSLLVKCALDEHDRVFAIGRAHQGTTHDVFSALTALMRATDETLDTPVTLIKGAPVHRYLGRGSTSVVVAILSGQANTESFVKIFRTQEEAESEFRMLQRLEEQNFRPFDIFERHNIPRRNTQGLLFTLIGSPVLERVHLSSMRSGDWMTLLGTIEHLHNTGVVHRDIRPDNFLLRRPDTKCICLIDYGYAIGLEQQVPFAGTVTYASTRILRAIEQGQIVSYDRADDLVSFVKCYSSWMFEVAFQGAYKKHLKSRTPIEFMAKQSMELWDFFLADDRVKSHAGLQVLLENAVAGNLLLLKEKLAGPR